MTEKRRRLTYANVMSSIAVFLCLGGTAVAAATIDGSSIDNRSIAGKKLIKNTVTGTEIKEGTLAKVPNADKLDGINSTGFVRGNNVAVLRASRQVAGATDTFVSLLTIPGFGPVTASCSTDGNTVFLRYHNATGSPVHFSLLQGAEDNAATYSYTTGNELDANADLDTSVLNSGHDSGFDFEIKLIAPNPAHSADISVGGVTLVDSGTNCLIAATVTFG